MATRTTADLSLAVLENLGLISAGEGVAAADHEFISRRYANMLEEMRDERLVYWDFDAIPFEAFEGVVTLMSLVVEKSFGLPGLKGEEFNDALDGAKRRIRARVGKPASGQPTEVGYF